MNIKPIVKKAVKAVFTVLVTPLVLLYYMLRLLMPEHLAFQEFSQLLSLVPGRTGIYLRAAFFRCVCYKTSANVTIGFLTVLSQGGTEIGDEVYIGPQSNIGLCKIGKNCVIGSGVHILSGKNQHNFTNIDKPIKDQGGVYTKIEIGDDCWIGNNAVIMDSVGRRCVVAAGAVVTNAVESYSIVGGNPARLIKKMPDNAGQ